MLARPEIGSKEVPLPRDYSLMKVAFRRSGMGKAMGKN
jgi:hypothetical protein